MKTNNDYPGQSPAGIGIPRRWALILAPLAWLVAIPLAHGVVPWRISLLAPWYGWAANHPGIWNLLGLLPIAGGAAGLLWVFIQGFFQAVELPERIELNWNPKLLMRRGPYAFSRNPMYVAEMALWFGWAVFFGSLVVFIGFAVLCVAMNFIVRREERALAAKFGKDYREYEATVPRWLWKDQR